MKKLLIISGLIFASSQLFGQKLEGKYSFSGIVGESIAFNNTDKTFEFLHSNCNFALKGRGRYRIKGKKLLLRFENSGQLVAPETPRKQAIIYKDSSQNSMYTVSIWVRDNADSSKPISYGSVSFVGTSNGKVTDTLGFARLRYEGSKPIYLQADSPMCEVEKILLNGPGNYHITAFLNCDLYKVYPVKDGEVYQYKIGKSTDKSIELTAMQNLKGELQLYWKRNN